MIKGVKEKGGSDETFITLEERSDYVDQVATISMVDPKGKVIADCIHLFSDGSVAFCEGIPKEQMCGVDENGRMKVLEALQKDVASSKPIIKNVKEPKSKTFTYKTIPFVGVRSCSCVKTTRLFKYNLAHQNTCPPYATLYCVDALSGQSVTHILSFYYDGAIHFASGALAAYSGIDAAKNGYCKIRGTIPSKK